MLNTKSDQVETFTASAVLLATGGQAKSTNFTTNPFIATGDGIVMAYRVGVEVRNMSLSNFILLLL